jgi:hypothetical protein
MKRILFCTIIGSVLNLSVCFGARVAPCWPTDGTNDLSQVNAMRGAGGCRLNQPSISPFASDCLPGGIATPISLLGVR